MYFMGIDISKEKIDCAIVQPDFKVVLEKVVKNKDNNIKSFIQAFLRKTRIDVSSLLICCEATGIYNKPLERVCSELGVALWVEHALKIKRASFDLRGKSDRQDAIRIADYCVRYQDRKVLIQRPSESVEELNGACKARETLLTQKVALENQLREAKSHDQRLYDQLNSLYKTTLTAITKDLKKIELQIEVILEKEHDMKTNVDLLKSIPGIGKQTAIQFVIYTNNFKNFCSAKHLACYSGVVPFTNESGTIIKKARISKMANLKLKTLLHLAAMAAIRTKTDLKEYFIRKVKEGKNKMSVLNAVRNKLVHRIWAIIQRQTPYTKPEIILSN